MRVRVELAPRDGESFRVWKLQVLRCGWECVEVLGPQYQYAAKQRCAIMLHLLQTRPSQLLLFQNFNERVTSCLDLLCRTVAGLTPGFLFSDFRSAVPRKARLESTASLAGCKTDPRQANSGQSVKAFGHPLSVRPVLKAWSHSHDPTSQRLETRAAEPGVSVVRGASSKCRPGGGAKSAEPHPGGLSRWASKLGASCPWRAKQAYSLSRLTPTKACDVSEVCQGRVVP